MRYNVAIVGATGAVGRDAPNIIRKKLPGRKMFML